MNFQSFSLRQIFHCCFIGDQNFFFQLSVIFLDEKYEIVNQLGFYPYQERQWETYLLIFFLFPSQIQPQIQMEFTLILDVMGYKSSYQDGSKLRIESNCMDCSQTQCMLNQNIHIDWQAIQLVKQFLQCCLISIGRSASEFMI